MPYILFDPRTDKLDLAKYFFNSLYPDQFIDALRAISNGNGFVNNEIGCLFPDVGDEDPFVGVMFFLLKEDMIVDDSTFMNLIKEAVAGFIRKCPERKAEVLAIVEEGELTKGIMLQNLSTPNQQ